MTEAEKNAKEYAEKIKWDSDTAFEHAYALLVECNLKDEAEALKVAHEKALAEFENLEVIEVESMFPG